MMRYDTLPLRMQSAVIITSIKDVMFYLALVVCLSVSYVCSSVRIATSRTN